MIRRDWIGPDGSPRWVLISQVEHARLAAELAEAWGDQVAALPPQREEFLATVRHHDDGWAEWERTPGVDPQTGQPRNFTEMPAEQAVAIWRRSIDRAERIGPLPAWLVAGHFMALVSGASAWQQTTPNQSEPARHFLDEMQRRQADWFDQWREADPAGNTPHAADRALHLLQLFDVTSLWFCCAQRDEPYPVAMPGEGAQVTLTPIDPQNVNVRPWPFRVDGLSLSVDGGAIPNRHYATAEELADEPRKPVRLTWKLTP